MGRRHHVALIGLSDLFQGDNISYIFRPVAQALAWRGFSAIRMGVCIVIVNDKLVTNLQRVFAEANETPVLLLGSCRIYMGILCLL